MDKKKISKIQGWLQYKNIIPIEKIEYVDHECMTIKYLKVYDMFRDIQKLLEVHIRFSLLPGIKEGYYIEIVFSDMDWDEIMGV